MGDHRRGECRLIGAHRLQRNRVPVKDRLDRFVRDGGRRTVKENRIGRAGFCPFIQLDFCYCDMSYTPFADNAFDGAQSFQFHSRNRRRVKHLWTHIRIKQDEIAAGFQTVEHIVAVFRVGHRFKGRRLCSDGCLEAFGPRLGRGAVQHPAIARNHPADHIRRHTTLQQMQKRIDPRLAAANDNIAVWRFRKSFEPVRWHEPHAILPCVRRYVVGGHAIGQEGGIDQTVIVDVECFAGQQMRERTVALILTLREIADAPAGQQSVPHNHVKIGANFAQRRQVGHAFVQAVLVDSPTRQFPGGHTVKARRLVQCHKRISHGPMPARGMQPIDDDHCCVCVGQQRVGKGQAHRASANDEVIGGEGCGHGGAYEDTEARRPVFNFRCRSARWKRAQQKDIMLASLRVLPFCWRSAFQTSLEFLLGETRSHRNDSPSCSAGVWRPAFDSHASPKTHRE